MFFKNSPLKWFELAILWRRSSDVHTMRDAGVLTLCFAPSGASPSLKGWLSTNCQTAKCSFSFEARNVKSALPGLLNPCCATLPLDFLP